MKVKNFDKLQTVVLPLTLLIPALVYGCCPSKQEKKFKTSYAGNFISFQMCDKNPKRFALYSYNKFPEDIVKGLPSYYVENPMSVRYWKYADVIQISRFPVASFSSPNGFVSAVLDAHKGHHNLIIRPDDIWAAIMIQFSFYVNKNAEKLRSKFFDLNGQNELTVKVPGALRKCSFNVFEELLIKMIHETLLDAKIRKWVLPNFSTTTVSDKVSIGALLLGTVKQHSSNEAHSMCCIPSLYVGGTLRDWQNINDRLEKLHDYGLSDWSSKLKPILRQFIEVKKGKVDLAFWEKICRVEGLRENCTNECITGWITAFTHFQPNGNLTSEMHSKLEKTKMTCTYVSSAWQNLTPLNVQDVPFGHVKVPVKIIDRDNKGFKSTMFAGHLAVQVEQHGYALQPSLGWGIALHKTWNYIMENKH